MSNVKNVTPALTIPERQNIVIWLPRLKTPMPDVANAATRLLTPTERATTRVRVADISKVPLWNSLLADAAYRVCLMKHRGNLDYLSGYKLAALLQTALWPEKSSRLSPKGWELLYLLDAAEMGVAITVDAEPTANNPMHRRTMRLRDRIAELTQ